MTGEPRPLATVVVPTFQRRAAVGRLLEALAAQTADPASFEVVIAVDGSSDGTVELVEAFPARFALRAAWQENAGRAVARNRAVAIARGDLLVLLDDDMVPSPGLVTAHLAAHERGEPRFVMGPAPVPVPQGRRPVLQYMAATRNEHYERLAQPGYVLHVRDLYCGNASLRRDVLLDAGGFDERYRTYGGEDVDLALRLRAAGVELVFAPDACASEDYEKSFPELAADMVEEGRNAVMLALAHPEAAAGQQFSEPWPQPWWWKAPRRGLVLLTRVVPAIRRAIVALTDRLDRRGARRMHLWLRFVLEYHYWLGAGPELRSARRAGKLLP